MSLRFNATRAESTFRSRIRCAFESSNNRDSSSADDITTKSTRKALVFTPAAHKFRRNTHAYRCRTAPNQTHGWTEVHNSSSFKESAWRRSPESAPPTFLAKYDFLSSGIQKRPRRVTTIWRASSSGNSVPSQFRESGGENLGKLPLWRDNFSQIITNKRLIRPIAYHPPPPSSKHLHPP